MLSHVVVVGNGFVEVWSGWQVEWDSVWQGRVGGRRLEGGEWRSSGWEVAGWYSEVEVEVQAGKKQVQEVCNVFVGSGRWVGVLVGVGPEVVVPGW